MFNVFKILLNRIVIFNKKCIIILLLNECNNRYTLLSSQVFSEFTNSKMKISKKYCYPVFIHPFLKIKNRSKYFFKIVVGYIFLCFLYFYIILISLINIFQKVKKYFLCQLYILRGVIRASQFFLLIQKTNQQILQK